MSLAQRALGVQTATLVFSLASVVLLLVVVIEYGNNTNAAVCDDYLPCTANVLTGPSPGWCENPPLPIGAACTSQCFRAGAAGTCGGPAAPECRPNDPRKCKGYCVQDPDEVVDLEDENGCIDLMLPLLRPGFYQDAEFNCLTQPNSIASNISACVANVCTLSQFMATAYEVNVEEEPFAIGGRPTSFSFIKCEDMLVPGPHQHCIHAIDVPTDMEWTTQLLVDAGYDERPYIGKLCTFIYQCGGFNMSAFSDPQYFENNDPVCSGKKKRMAVSRPVAVGAGKELGLGKYGHGVLEKLALGVARRIPRK